MTTTGSTKCSCRWSTNSMDRPSISADMGDEVEHGEMLDQLAQPHPAGVRDDRDPELGGQQEIGDVLVDAGHSRGVDLHDVDGAGLEELLEHDPVLDRLTRGDLHRRDRPSDCGMTEHVVRAGRFLDPVGRVRRQFRQPFDRLPYVPLLVGVDGYQHVRTDCFAGERQASLVIFDRASDLQFDEARIRRQPPPGTTAPACHPSNPATRGWWHTQEIRARASGALVTPCPFRIAAASRPPRPRSTRPTGTG